jgi:hypothetical protein
MNHRSRRAFALLAVGFALSLFAPAVHSRAKAADATGTWKWTVERNGQTFDVTLKLKQDDKKLSGAMIGRNGNETAIEDAKVDGDEVSFTVVRTFGDNKVVQKYKGKLNGDSIKGKIEVDRDGEKTTRDWEAKRS